MPTDPYELARVPDRDEIFEAYRLREESRTVTFEWLMPPTGVDRGTSRVRVTNITESGDELLIEGNDVGVTQGPNGVRLKVNHKTNTGEIIYL